MLAAQRRELDREAQRRFLEELKSTPEGFMTWARSRMKRLDKATATEFAIKFNTSLRTAYSIFYSPP